MYQKVGAATAMPSKPVGELHQIDAPAVELNALVFENRPLALPLRSGRRTEESPGLARAGNYPMTGHGWREGIAFERLADRLGRSHADEAGDIAICGDPAAWDFFHRVIDFHFKCRRLAFRSQGRNGSIRKPDCSRSRLRKRFSMRDESDIAPKQGTETA